MWQRLKRLRVEIFLGLSLFLPVLIPRAAGLDGLLASMVSPVLPEMVPLPSDESGWRDLSYRLMAENADLRARLLALGEPAKLQAMDPTFYARNPVRVEAAVVGRDASLFRGSVLISAGTREGLRPGLAVLVGEALVGTIADVGPLSARVRLLGDPGQRVWAEIVSGAGPAEGCVVGEGEETLDMQLVRAGPGREGDPVFTAAGDPLVPRGLLLGTVTRIADVDRNGVSEVDVAPAVRPAAVRFVNVLVVEAP